MTWVSELLEELRQHAARNPFVATLLIPGAGMLPSSYNRSVTAMSNSRIVSHGQTCPSHRRRRRQQRQPLLTTTSLRSASDNPAAAATI